MHKILIFGGGSKFGLHLSNEFSNLKCEVEIVTSSTLENLPFKQYKIDWLTLDRTTIQKLCKQFQDIDVIIFNQNYSQINELENISVSQLDMMGNLKKLAQGHFVNCELALQVCNSLYVNKKFKKNAKAVWMLSESIDSSSYVSLEYKLQKYTNYQFVNYINNSKILNCLGIYPGKIQENDYAIKAKNLANFLTNKISDTTEPYYTFDDRHMVMVKK